MTQFYTARREHQHLGPKDNEKDRLQLPRLSFWTLDITSYEAASATVITTTTPVPSTKNNHLGQYINHGIWKLSLRKRLNRVQGRASAKGNLLTTLLTTPTSSS